MLAEAFVGTSGFAYREWVGPVYPPGSATSQLLPHYAQRLSAVEITSTYTRVPASGQFAQWAASVPRGFQFAVKAPHRIGRDLPGGRAAARALAAFVEAAEPLEDRLGPLLIQVPDAMPGDRRGLTEFLREAPEGLRLAFDFVHPSWHTDATLRVLSEHDAALVITDFGEGAPRIELTAGFAYVRLRRDDEAPEWAERLAALTRRGVDVYAFLKHDRRGAAVERAQRLSAQLRTQSEIGEQALLT